MSDNNTGSTDIELISSGISALDTLLNGGFVRGRAYLVQGTAGTGKSLLGQQFLREGLDNGENVVYIHGEETEKDILINTGQVNIDLSDADFLDIGPGSDFFAEDIRYELVDTTEIESERFTDDIKEVIEKYDPERLLIDPITQLRYIETDQYQFRKRIQSLIRFLRERGVTVIGTRTTEGSGPGSITYDEFASLSDGIINLFLTNDERRISVPKHRGLGQKDGTHALEIRDNGLEVYPKVLPDYQDRTFNPELLQTNNEALDKLLGGGIERGSVTFISGPTGVGKSTTGAEVLEGMARQGGSAATYLFEESIDQYMHRAENLGINLSQYRTEGLLSFQEIGPLDISAEEFVQKLIAQVEESKPDVVFIDGLSGFKLSLQGDQDRLVNRLYALTQVLKHKGVAVIITDEAPHLTGISQATSTNTSYIADNILFLTYLEIGGVVERAMGVIKKRLGDYDNRYHRFTIESGSGVSIGDSFEDSQVISSDSSILQSNEK